MKKLNSISRIRRNKLRRLRLKHRREKLRNWRDATQAEVTEDGKEAGEVVDEVKTIKRM